MVHGNKLRKFGRKTNKRNALMASLAVSLILRGKIRNTSPKAKSLRPFVEKLVTIGKSDKSRILQAQRLIAGRIGIPSARKIIKDIAPKYTDRKGGYLRISKLPRRAGDATEMALIEFV